MRDEVGKCQFWRPHYSNVCTTLIPFPPHTSGFLYYHQPQDAPLLVGQLRFRLTPDRLPQSFSQGKDCLTPEGDVWKIPLIVLHHYEAHRHIYRQLRLDGFVSDALHSKLAALEFVPRNTSMLLHSLHQVFPVDFATSYLRFYAIGDSTCRIVDIRHIFASRRSGEQGTPFTSAGDLFLHNFIHWKLINDSSGKGLVRLELSTLPEHAGTRTIVMRVVKLVGDPGSYLGEDRPVEGELVLRHNPHGESKLLCFDVDRDSPRRRKQTFSHPDALPLLLANTFGDKHKRP